MQAQGEGVPPGLSLVAGWCAHQHDKWVVGAPSALHLFYCDDCDRDQCLVPGPSGDGVCQWHLAKLEGDAADGAT